DNSERGTVWYPPEHLTEQEDEAAPPPLTNSNASKEPEIQEFEAIQKRLTELRQIAIINPTQENIRLYIAFQEAQMQRASTFADQW
ncbi:conjugal transfer protein TraF, partial [Pseudomonas aeruginosa]|uniref:conjugal transfer protein TraF n=1 Tax=Pseudomonas aeruginosa TaxID=287 RepID=UPI0039C2530C